MFALWFTQGEEQGFFLLLPLVILSLLRWRFPKLRLTLLLDCAVCILLTPIWGFGRYALVLIMFEGMYRKLYPIAAIGLFALYILGDFSPDFIVLISLGALTGLFLGYWQDELSSKTIMRDEQAGEFYELESSQSELISAIPEVERMTAVAERARIARDIHDNAGHEIVAAYISLQTVRGLFDGADPDALELYDAAMERLDKGVKKIRETAHNLQTVTTVGVEALVDICEKYPKIPVKLSSYGDTSLVPMYVWNVLEACLNESLTNVSRHSRAGYVKVNLDTTKHIVRLYIENDGVFQTEGYVGTGLRNMRQRVTAIGGTFSTDISADKFRTVCVIPIKETQ